VGKRRGRVSDSALVGSGTWADAVCAVSATGEGELFIRAGFARAVAVAVAAGRPLDAACREGLSDVAALGGSGGCIAVDRDGAATLRFDTEAMPRGVLRAGEPARIALGPEPSL